ncbi:MAG: SRPBCC domain-containing protein [Tepidisphaeraceae bacterium]|jgi:uncharacterized protein YndB with AHSA1/START domain
MQSNINSAAQYGSADERDFVISRVFDAPRDLVFSAWTEPNRLAQWFGPKGCTIRVAKMEMRPGGVLHSCMKTPDGREMWGKWVIREVVPPRRLVFVNSFSNEEGGMTRHPLSPTWPLQMLTTVTFVEQDGKTEITLRWIPINSTDVENKTFDAGRDSMNMGWGGTFDQLDAYLAQTKGDRQ